jgi:hypothetical protein
MMESEEEGDREITEDGCAAEMKEGGRERKLTAVRTSHCSLLTMKVVKT